jgi:microcystin-dependent protein
MSQYDFGTIDPYVWDGEQLANALNRWRDSLYTMHRGPARPPYAVAGMTWINDNGGPENWIVMIYLGDPAGDVPFLSYNTVTGDIQVVLVRNPGNPPGAIILYGGLTAPDGYLLCDGSLVGRDDYEDLFTAIGVLFGPGDGTTTFALPDMRGRVAAGRDIGAGRLTQLTVAPDGNTMGGRGGQQQEQVTVDINALGGTVDVTVNGASLSGRVNGNVTTDGSFNGVTTGDGGSPNYSYSWHQHVVRTDGLGVSISGNASGAGNIRGGTGSGYGTSRIVTNVQPTLLLDYYIKT